MPETCARCLMSFQRHLVVRARCTKRWRGHNFDAAAAEGAVGAAVANVLGLSVRTTPELKAFYERAFVRAYGAGVDPNPGAAFDVLEGEDYEFHVGLRAAIDDATFASVEKGAREAVATSRHFVLA